MKTENNDLTIAYMAGYHKAKGEYKDDFESREKELLAQIEKLTVLNQGETLPTKESLIELFNYVDGELVWAVKRRGTKGKGTIAGSIYTDGYRVIQLHGKRYGAHRLVWIYNNNTIEDGFEIDHIDGNRANNNIENLRAVSRQENNFNATTAKGYCWDKAVGKWKAYIKTDGKGKHLGHYDNELDAEQAYLSAKQKYHKIGVQPTCENCKYHEYIGKSFKRCSELEINTPKDFGCLEFERKDK